MENAIHQEIERKFLVDGDFMKDVYNTTHIRQGYLSSEKGRTVRVRTRDDKGYLTIKGSSTANGFSRMEWEKEIPLDEAEGLMKLCGDEVIDKERHLVRQGNHIFEVDVFHGLNEGLVMAEVELGSEDEEFERPSWLGKEVTGDKRYYNSRLIGNPFTRW